MEKIYADSTELLIFDWDFIASHMYVIPFQNTAIIIDPVLTSEVITYFTVNYQLNDILIILTHEHFDHINGLNWFQNNFSTTTYCSRNCFDNIGSVSKNLSDKSEVIRMFNNNNQITEKPVEPFECHADMFFEHCHELNFHSNNLKLFSTPGHSPGSICIILNDSYLFSGDTLLEYPTVTRLPGGNRKDFFDITLPFLKRQSKTIKSVFPGHGLHGDINNFLKKYP